MDLGSEGVSSPPCPRRHLGGDPSLRSLFLHLQLLIVGTVRFLSHRLLG
jgi:hypothetical protein